MKIAKFDTQAFLGEDNIAHYWAGFIAADGCIWANRLRIELSSKDIKHLYKFKKFINTKNKIFKQKRKQYESCSIIISSNLLVEQLSKFKITPRKSLTLEFPSNLTYNQTLSFIAGYIDGDGTIGHSNGNFIGMCGTKRFLDKVKAFMDYHFSSSYEPAKVNHTKDKSFYYRINSNRASNLYAEIKKLSLPLLDRKWKVLDYYD